MLIVILTNFDQSFASKHFVRLFVILFNINIDYCQIKRHGFFHVSLIPKALLGNYYFNPIILKILSLTQTCLHVHGVIVVCEYGGKILCVVMKYGYNIQLHLNPLLLSPSSSPPPPLSQLLHIIVALYNSTHSHSRFTTE